MGFKTKTGRAFRGRAFIMLSKIKDDEGNYLVKWSSVKGVDGWITFDLQTILDVVNIDLQNAFQSVSGEVVRQIHGCPIAYLQFMRIFYALTKKTRQFEEFVR